MSNSEVLTFPSGVEGSYIGSPTIDLGWITSAPLREVADEFLSRQPSAYQNFIDAASYQVVRTIGHSGPIHQIFVVPTAAPQESSNIYRTLSQYSGFNGNVGRLVLVSSNWTTGANMEAVEQTQREIQRFTEGHPHVKVGVFNVEYPAGTRIGAIQRHAEDTAVSLVAEISQAHPQLKDVQMISHAADIVSLNPYYGILMLERFRAAMERDGIALWQNGITRHQPDPKARFPYMDRLVALHDLHAHLLGGYALGTATGVRAYTAANGFDPACITSESEDLRDRIHAAFGTPWFPGKYEVPGALALISARRMYHRLTQGTALADMWVEGEFSATEAYRDPSRQYNDIPRDVYAERRGEFLTAHSEEMTTLLTGRFVRKGYPKQDAELRAHQHIQAVLSDEQPHTLLAA